MKTKLQLIIFGHSARYFFIVHNRCSPQVCIFAESKKLFKFHIFLIFGSPQNLKGATKNQKSPFRDGINF